MDALLPPDMARRAEQIGVEKAGAPALRLFTLAVLAGAFIALGGAFSNTVTAGSSSTLPFGVARLLAGLAFSLGLLLVIVGGAELFTGNALIVMAWASRKVATVALLRNWGIVFAGNAVGALATAGLVLLSGHPRMGGGAVGEAALALGAGKVGLDFGEAVVLGVLCNGLVCLAVWMSLSATSTADRVLAVVPPIAAFVACGFEHSIANLYAVPLALGIAASEPGIVASSGIGTQGLTTETFLLHNLLPVTLGNVIGGALLVGCTYWLVYLRRA